MTDTNKPKFNSSFMKYVIIFLLFVAVLPFVIAKYLEVLKGNNTSVKTETNKVTEVAKTESVVTNNVASAPQATQSQVIQQQVVQQQVVVQPKVTVPLATIISTTPQYKEQTKYIPFNDCHEQTRTVYVKQKKEDGTRGGVIGGVTGATAGAVIGNQVKQGGEGTAIGAVVGLIAGAVAGNKIEKNQDEDVAREITQNVCEQKNKVVTENILTGYLVRYKYQGEINTILLKNRPRHNVLPLSKLLNSI